MARVADAPQTVGLETFRAVFFDLDGTLIDHFETLYRCYRYALEKIGVLPPTPEEVRRSVGGSMEVTMRRFVSEAQFPEAARHWREMLARINLEDVKLMPGGRSLVQALHERGLRVGVLTNKIGDQSRAIIEHVGLGRHVELVLGANDTPFRKPQREFSLLALERLDVTARHACLIGDSPYDIASAQAVEMRCFCVSTGTHTEDELRAAGADGVYRDLYALGRSVFGLKLREEHIGDV